jgi:hypothetical protein
MCFGAATESDHHRGFTAWAHHTAAPAPRPQRTCVWDSIPTQVSAEPVAITSGVLASTGGNNPTVSFQFSGTDFGMVGQFARSGKADLGQVCCDPGTMASLAGTGTLTATGFVTYKDTLHQFFGNGRLTFAVDSPVFEVPPITADETAVFKQPFSFTGTFLTGDEGPGANLTFDLSGAGTARVHVISPFAPGQSCGGSCIHGIEYTP